MRYQLQTLDYQPIGTLNHRGVITPVPESFSSYLEAINFAACKVWGDNWRIVRLLDSPPVADR